MAYIDVVVLVALIIFVIVYSKKFDGYFLGFGAIDVSFRVLNLIKNIVPNKDVIKFIKTYVPESVVGIINKYTTDVINTALTFVYIIVMSIFLYLIIKVFLKRKKL